MLSIISKLLGFKFTAGTVGILCLSSALVGGSMAWATSHSKIGEFQTTIKNLNAAIDSYKTHATVAVKNEDKVSAEIQKVYIDKIKEVKTVEKEYIEVPVVSDAPSTLSFSVLYSYNTVLHTGEAPATWRSDGSSSGLSTVDAFQNTILPNNIKLRTCEVKLEGLQNYILKYNEGIDKAYSEVQK